MIQPIFLLLAVLLIGGILLLVRRFGIPVSTPDSRPVQRHWALRIFGALLATGIVIALAIGTWTASHPDDIDKPITVLAPSLPLPPLPDLEKIDHGEVDVPPCRIVATLVLARVISGEMVPLAAESKIIEWPAARGQELSFSGNHAGVNYLVRLVPNDFGLTGRDSGLAIRGRSSTECQSFDSNSYTGGGWVQELEGMETLTDMNNRFARHAPLSLLPRPREMLYLALDLRRAAAADSMQSIPIDGWMRPTPEDVAEEWKMNKSMDRYDGVQPDAPPGMKLLVHLGPSSLLLLLAAVAGSQAFRHRGHATAALLVMFILFAGAMEHLVWQRRAAIARDAARPMTTRLLAAKGLSDSFFHPKRVEEELPAMLQDPSLPDGLRHALREQAFQLQTRPGRGR